MVTSSWCRRVSTSIYPRWSASVGRGNFGIAGGNSSWYQPGSSFPHHRPLQPPAWLATPHPQHGHQQVRWVTKKRIHRQEKRKRKEELAAQGIFPPKPHRYIPKDTPILNAMSRDEQRAMSKTQDEQAARELQGKLKIVKEPLMRFHFGTGQDLKMSDRVRRLLQLQNGNQHEVVQAQKQRGMELFQLREGDTGSSAVQGTYIARCFSKSWNLIYIYKARSR